MLVIIALFAVLGSLLGAMGLIAFAPVLGPRPERARRSADASRSARRRAIASLALAGV